MRSPAQRLDPSKTVFVGALHGMLNAEALASIMNDLFGGVMYAGIDTDKHKYPIGKTTWARFSPLFVLPVSCSIMDSLSHYSEELPFSFLIEKNKFPSIEPRCVNT